MGYQSKTKQNRGKRIPLNYTTVNIDIPAFNVFSTVFKTNVVFHMHMLCERKFRKTGDILYVSSDFSIHEWATLSMAFL